MGGGLMQLVAYGAQDIYLTGNPQITFFKVVYRRHTNFSMEAIQQTIQGKPSDGGNSVVTISRNGDLVYRMYVTIKGVKVTTGTKLVSEAEIEIGGQMIDRHYEEWMNIWNELTTPESKANGFKMMVRDVGKIADSIEATLGTKSAQIPLQFWFCRNPGLALPLISLQYHEVKLKLKWGAANSYMDPSSNNVATAQVWCDYIYLDTDERRRFAQVSHEYLIEQVQKHSLQAKVSHELVFNHPVKELIWTNTNYTSAKLKLNGHDRFAGQNPDYFKLRQPYDHHTAIPKQNISPLSQVNSNSVFKTIGNPVYLTVDDSSDPGGNFSTTVDRNNTSCGKIYINNTTIKLRPTNGNTTPNDNTTPRACNSASDSSIVAGDILAIKIHKVLLKEDMRVVDDDGSSEKHSAPVGDIFYCVAKTVPEFNFDSAAANTDTSNTDNTLEFTLDDNPRTLAKDGVVKKLTALAHTDAGTFDIDNQSVSLYKVESSQARTSKMTESIHVYSFALKPEEHQPSGTCNFSRIDNATLELTGNTATGNIYAVNYNVLRIMSGMGGLAYSN